MTTTENKNIKTIYKPDNGFIDRALERALFPVASYKICDCIVVCQNDNIAIVEIMCGLLTYREFQEKSQQLENCCKVVQHQKQKDKIKKIVLLYDRLESPKRNPQFRKKLLDPKVCSKQLRVIPNNKFSTICK